MHISTYRYAFGADINETKIIEVADAMVTLGLRDAGYTYVGRSKSPFATENLLSSTLATHPPPPSVFSRGGSLLLLFYLC